LNVIFRRHGATAAADATPRQPWWCRMATAAAVRAPLIAGAYFHDDCLPMLLRERFRRHAFFIFDMAADISSMPFRCHYRLSSPA
jgi:hypothetical protein